ncbi:uncharacterized protein LOC144476106 [Augochlora pura]
MLQANIPTKNRYDILSSFASNPKSNLDKHDPTPTPILPPPSSDDTHTATKPPPIYINSFNGNIKALTQALLADYGPNFSLKYLGNKVKIQLNENKHHTDLQHKLRLADKPFHTYTPNHEKSLVVILRGLPNINIQDIQEEIESLGLKPSSITPLGSKPDPSKSQYTIYKITFSPGTSFNAVNKIGHLFYTKVYWEKFFSRKNYTQCFRCQAFGHSSKNCNLPPKCVKCAGSHLTKTCTKPKDTPATCSNCHGNHTANYTQCPALIKYIAKKTPTTKTLIQPTTPSPPPFIPAQPPKPLAFSYKDALTNSNTTQKPTPRPTQTQTTPAETFSEAADVFSRIGQLVDINLMLQKAKELEAKLMACTTEAQKFQAFLSIYSSFN